MDLTPLSAAPTGAAIAPPPANAVTCGGCFKPVDTEASYKRTVHVAASSRYSRFSRGSKPAPARVEHFCDSMCHQRAQTAAHGNGGFRF